MSAEQAERIINELAVYAWAYPITAKSVRENVNEANGFWAGSSCMEWCFDMYREAHAQFANLIDAGEAS